MNDYDSEALAELCSKIDLLDYASNSIDFEGTGDHYAAHCTRHIDKTPSLIITPSKNLFHCFSCGVGGNIISWMMAFEKMSYNEAVAKLGSLTGVDIQKFRQCSALKIFKEMARMSQPAKVTMSKRTCLDDSEILKYDAEPPMEWVDEGIDPDIMQKYNIRIDKSANRIVYPLYDSKFSLIGIKGRTRYRNYKEMKIQKYQSYQKIGTVDFFIGMKENRENIIKQNEAIIFEGIKSGMKVEQWGYDYWLSSETSWLNDSQVMLLIKLGVKTVTIAYDNDVPIKKIKECTDKLRKFVNVYAIIDWNQRLGNSDGKLAPCDKGREIWETLYQEKRRVL